MCIEDHIQQTLNFWLCNIFLTLYNVYYYFLYKIYMKINTLIKCIIEVHLAKSPVNIYHHFLSVVCSLQISFWLIWAFLMDVSSILPNLIVNFSHFQLLKSHCMSCHQTYLMCTFKGLEEVLYLVEMIRIQDGYPGLLLAKTFSTSSPELLHLKLPDLP